MAIPVMVALRGEASGLMSALGQAGSGMQGLAGNTEELAKKLGGIAGALTMAGAGIGVAVTKMAMDYETAMTRVYTASNMTKQEFGMVSEEVLNMSSEVGYAATDLADAMLKVYSAGFHGQDALNVLRVAAEGAQVGVGDLTATSKALATMMFALNIPADQAVATMDKLMTAVRIGNVELGEMSTAMSNIIPAARVTGVSLDEVAAAMAVMTAAGMPAANAGTNLRMTLLQLSRITPHAAEAMHNFGVSATDVSTKLGERGLAATLNILATAIDEKLGSNLRGLDTQLRDLAGGSLEEFSSGLESLPESQRAAIGALADMLGGVKSLQGALLLMGPGAKDFQDAIAQVGEAGKNAGTDVSKFGAVTETTAFKWENLKNKLKELAIEVGERLMPWVEKLINGLKNVADWCERNSTVIKVLAAVLGIFMVAALIMVIALIGIFVLALATVAVAIGLIIGVILGLVFGIKWLVENFDMLLQKLSDFGDGVIRFGQLLWNMFGSIFAGIPAMIGGFFAALFSDLVGWFGNLTGLFSSGWSSIANITTGSNLGMTMNVSDTWNGILGFLTGIWSTLVGYAAGAWGQIWGSIQNAMSGSLGSVIEGMNGIVSAVYSGFSGALSAAASFVGSFFSVGVNIIQGVWSGVMSMAGALASAAANVVRSALNAAKAAIGINSPSYDFKMQVGVQISAGIIEGIRALSSDVDKAVSDVVRGPLSGDYAFSGSVSGNGAFKAQGNAQGTVNGMQINVNVDFSGTFYGQGGARQAALDIQRELLRIQQSGDLGIVGSITGTIG